MLRFSCLFAGLSALGVMISQAQAVTYQQIVLADSPTYYWTWNEASGAALNYGTGSGGILGAGSAAARTASTTNAGGLSLGSAASFTGVVQQWWFTGSTGGSVLNDGTYSSYAIEFWFFGSSSNSMYVSNVAPVGILSNDPSVIFSYQASPDNNFELFTQGLPQRTGAAFPAISLNAWHHVVLAYQSVSDGTDIQTCIIDGNYAGRTSAVSSSGVTYLRGKLVLI